MISWGRYGSRRLRITIISLVFPPETGAARRVGELASFLRSKGHAITVVTAFPSYPKGEVFPGFAKRPMKTDHTLEGIEVRRVYLYTTTKRDDTFRRMLHYGTFTATSLVGASTGARSPDIIYVVSPPYFLGLSGLFASAVRGSGMAFDVQDFWPEAPIALGYVRNKAAVAALLALEEFVYQRSDLVFALSDVMKRRILERGVAEHKVHCVHNWVDLDQFRPHVNGMSLKKELGLEHRFVVLFAGNMGYAQGLDAMVDAASLLGRHPRVVLVLLGDGVELDRIRRRVQVRGLSNVIFVDRVDEDKVPEFYAMADVLLATLRKAKHREAAIPSKLQTYMAAAKPVVLAADGASASIVLGARCGRVVPSDDYEELARALIELSQLPLGVLESMGARGRCYAGRHFSREQQCGRIEEQLVRWVATNETARC